MSALGRIEPTCRTAASGRQTTVAFLVRDPSRAGLCSFGLPARSDERFNLCLSIPSSAVSVEQPKHGRGIKHFCSPISHEGRRDDQFHHALRIAVTTNHDDAFVSITPSRRCAVNFGSRRKVGLVSTRELLNRANKTPPRFDLISSIGHHFPNLLYGRVEHFR